MRWKYALQAAAGVLLFAEASHGQKPVGSPPGRLSARVPRPDLLQMAMARGAVVYGAGLRKIIPNDAGEFRRIAVLPGEKVTIAVTLPVAQLGDLIDVTAVDGGITDALPSGLAVGPASVALFTFQAASSPGLYRVWVDEGNNRYVLSFGVVDPANPQPGRNAVVAY